MRRHLRRSNRALAVALAGVGAAAGCSSGLETGYVPRPLGASEAERRGYYASPYTPEAAAAAQVRKDPGDENRSLRRPGAF